MEDFTSRPQWEALQKDKIKILPSSLEQRKFQRQIAVVMSEIKGDPRWKVYADHIVAKKELLMASAAVWKKKITDPSTFLSPEEYGKCKVKVAILESSANGMQYALDIMQDLIDRGKEPALIEGLEKTS